jgi:transposase
MSSRGSTVEVVTRSGRRRFSTEEKLAIVRETLTPAASVGNVARRHGLSANLVYTWRKRALAGAMSGFVSVEIGGEEPPALAAPVSPNEERGAACSAHDQPRSADRHSLIEVELPNGCRLRVASDVDAGALRRVLAVLGAPRG